MPNPTPTEIKLEVGVRVRAVVEGVVSETYGGQGEFVTIGYASDAGTTYVTVIQTAPGVIIERLAPAEWPPQPGDLWRDRDGCLWFTIDCLDWPVLMVAVRGGGGENPDEASRQYGPMTLVYRDQAESEDS